MLHIQPVDTNSHGESPDAVSPSINQPTAESVTAQPTAQPAYEQRFYRKMNRTRSRKNGLMYQANKMEENLNEAQKFVEQANARFTTENDAKVLFALASKTLSGFRLKQPKA